MRLILLTGGGGAGVTTLAAATALCCARRGLRTTLAAADPAAAASLLGRPETWPRSLDVTPASPIGPLDGAGTILTWLASLLHQLGWSGVGEEVVTALPAVRGLLALLAAETAASDVAVIDLGPVSESLPLLHALCTAPPEPAPDRSADVAGRVVAALAAQFVNLPRPTEAVRSSGRRLAATIDHLRDAVRDPARCSLRVVLPPDPRAAAVVTESRTVAGLWGLGLDAFVTRQPAATGAEPGVPPLIVPVSAEPPQGCAALLALGESVYADRPPERPLAPAEAPRFELRDSGADLVLPLPPRPADGFGVSRQTDAIDLRAGPWRRRFRLPPSIRPLHGRRAWHDGRVFRVRFER